jgi:DNA-directed RNA polymerase specialized sigma24 family protein
MPETRPIHDIDGTFERVCDGDRIAFAEWMGAVEAPIRRSIARYARAVDVESVLQETLLRMWVYAQDRGRELEGEAASLRFAIGMARNIARSEARRLGRVQLLPPEDLPEVEVQPEPPPDPALMLAIQECLRRLKGKPLAALRARLNPASELRDRDLARGVGMTLNTFLQNVVRARKAIAECLRRRGVALEEALT